MNKTEYWKNRKAGKRGQGEYPVTAVRDVEASKLPSFRKQERQKIADFRYTKKLRKATAPHVVNDYSYQIEKPDPTVSNHDRLVARRSKGIRR